MSYLRYRSTGFIYHVLVRRLDLRIVSMTSSSDNAADYTMAKTYQKFFNLPDDGKISRHTFVNCAAKLKQDVEKLNGSVEAVFVHSAFMELAKMYGLDKFPEEGGNEYTLKEMCDVLRAVPKESLAWHATIMSRALFRAIDTNCNGTIGQDEWIAHLKLRNSYQSDEQAIRSFGSLDKNKDGHISLEEFEAHALKFWTNTGNQLKDYYGTDSAAN